MNPDQNFNPVAGSTPNPETVAPQAAGVSPVPQSGSTVQQPAPFAATPASYQSTAPVGQQNPMAQQVTIPDHKVLAIIAIFFGGIFGIIALLFSLQVNSKVAVGDIAGAQSASKKAKTLSIIGYILSGLVITVQIIGIVSSQS